MFKYFGTPLEVDLEEALEEVGKFPKKSEFKGACIAFNNEKGEEIILNRDVSETNKDFNLMVTSPQIAYGDLTLAQVKDVITHFYHGQPWMHLYSLHTSAKENELMKKELEEIKKDALTRLEKELGKHYTFACQLLSGDPEEAYITYDDEKLELIIMKFKDPSGKYELTRIEKKIKELIGDKKIKCEVVAY